MTKLAVLNDVHDTGSRIACWMLRDLGYRVYVADDSFRDSVHVLHSGWSTHWQQRTTLCDGVMSRKHLPADAVFVDAYPQTEGALRKSGWNGKFLIYWIWPCGPEWAEQYYRPGKNVGALTFNNAIFQVIQSRGLGLAEFVWPPYQRLLQATPRSSFERFVVTAIHNAAGCTNVPFLEKLRDDPRSRLELYGSQPPSWARPVPQGQLVARMRSAMALFHWKATDTPGYALMEAVLQAVPVILSPDFMRTTDSRYIWKDGETCFTPAGEAEVWQAIERLSNPSENLRIGTAGRNALLSHADWSVNRPKVQQLIDRIGV